MKKTQLTTLAAIICSLIGVNGSYAAQISPDLKSVQNLENSVENILVNGDFQGGDSGWWVDGGSFNTQDQMGCF